MTLPPTADTKPNPMLAAAIEYARLGLPVFALAPRSKFPRKDTHSFEDATTDEQQITRWWTEDPRRNIGIATGHLVDVADIDGPEGWESLAKYLAELGLGLNDFTVLGVASTPRESGNHLFVPTVPGTGGAGLLDSVDLRAAGGYVVAPPSVTDVGRYVWERALDLTLPVHQAIALQNVLRGAQTARKAQEAAEQAAQRTAQRAQQPNPFGPSTGKTTPVTEVSDERRQAWLAVMLDRAAERLGRAPVKTRNNELNRVAYTLGGIVHLGLDEQAARDTLESIARQIGLEPGEIPKTLNSGFGKGKLKPLTVELAERDLPGGSPGEQPAVSIADDFWDASPELTTIRAYARARMVSPAAMLGCVLARVVTSVDSQVVLPPLVGGYISLNLFVALVGVSGAGKGAADQAAASAFVLHGLDFEEAGIGSGEGIGHLFARRVKDKIVRLADAVLLNVPEVDTLAALRQRQSSTLSPELRKTWDGAALGFAYVDPSKRLPLAAHSYRLCLLLGVQPARAGTLLDDADGGTPQRFVWLPAIDRDAPDVPPEAPDPVEWHKPELPPSPPFTKGLRVLPVCEEAKQTIRAARLARLRGNGEALESHALLCRLKVAAALGLLDGRCSVSEQDWHLAGMLMEASDRTRSSVAEALRRRQRNDNLARGHAEGERDVVRLDRVEVDRVQRTGRAITGRLRRAHDDDGWVTAGVLRRDLAKVLRPYLDEALDKLEEAGQIEVEPIEYQGQSSRRVRLAERGAQ